MNLLLDTHTLLWLFEGDATLSKTARDFITEPNNTNFVSVATFWEIAIKISIGKLEMSMPLSELHTLVWENGIEILPIQIEHTLAVSQMPMYHKDPFDRIIIAQAISTQMNLIGCDVAFDPYFEGSPIKRIW